MYQLLSYFILLLYKKPLQNQKLLDVKNDKI